MKAYVNVIVGKSLPQSVRREFLFDSPLRLILHDINENVLFRFDDIEDMIGTRLDSLVKDLLDIAVAIYMSDQYIERDSNLARKISILIPVRNPAKWNTAKNTLVQTVAFLMRNEFDIYFIQGKNEPSSFGAYQSKTTEDCVCSLSGGLDSAAGGFWLIDNGKNPFFVSHYSSGKLSGFQKEVVGFLKSYFKKDFKHCQVHIAKSKRKTKSKLKQATEQQMIQFSRSFLYLSLGSAVALTSKLGELYICENGPIALNVPISEARLNTRTVHPKFLYLYQRLIQEVFGVSLLIKNPFLYETKAAVVSRLGKTPELSGLIKITCSCWKYSRVSNIAKQRKKPEFDGNHCGECYPCIMRRIAVKKAGLSSFDDKYLVDVFRDYPPEDRETLTLIADLLRFAHDLKRSDIGEIFVKYPDFSIDVEGVEPANLVEMYKQFATETIETFDVLGNEILKKQYGFLLR